MKEAIQASLKSSIALKNNILNDEKLLLSIERAVDIIVKTYQQKGKVLLCGNGGSAADAQHIAAELSGRFCFDRPPLYAEALHVNTSYITAVANDYSFDNVFSRMIVAAGQQSDVLIAISTSGNSKNIVQAVKQAKQQGMLVIGFTGNDGGLMRTMCDCLLNVPSQEIPRIQEIHITIGHIICELVEKQLFA